MANVIQKLFNLFREKKEIVVVHNEEKTEADNEEKIDFDKLKAKAIIEVQFDNFMKAGMSCLDKSVKYLEDENYSEVYLLNDKAIKVFEKAQELTNEEDMKETIQRFIEDTKEKNNMMLLAMALEKKS